MSIGWVYGLHAVTAILEQVPDKIIELFVQTGRTDERVTKITQLAKQQGLSVQAMSRAALDKKAEGASHQGVVARCRYPEQKGSSELMHCVREGAGDLLLLILDGIQDPHNLGASLRIADSAGFDGVVVPKSRSVGMTPVVAKVASGAAFSVPLFEVSNLGRTLKQLKQAGVWIYGTSDSAEATIYASRYSKPMAWVMGAEGDGIRPLTAELCDFLVSIPMHGSVSSLNVSAACAVCLFETVRQLAESEQS